MQAAEGATWATLNRLRRNPRALPCRICGADAQVDAACRALEPARFRRSTDEHLCTSLDPGRSRDAHQPQKTTRGAQLVQTTGYDRGAYLSASSQMQVHDVIRRYSP